MVSIEIIYAAILSFVICVISSPIFIPILRRLKFGQSIREDGPKTHLIKSGTPTIGGIIILLGLIITGAFFGTKYKEIYTILFFTVGCGLVGFADDYIKVVLKRSLGLTAMQKLLALIFITVFFVLYIYNYTDIGSKLLIPFVKNYSLDLGMFYIPFIIFVILGTINSVNLTDGLDGLSSGITVIVSIFFVIASLIMGNITVAIFSAILGGSCLGFLIFNIHPAKVFMGDTGSLALGGAIAAIAVTLKMPIFLLITGGVFVIETLSVIIQVMSYKFRKKRVFKMAPLHHHFEMIGWKETKVVTIFWTITGILNLIGLLSLI